MSKKVALLLPGLTRSAKLCHDSIYKNILSKYDVDIYMHVWDISNISLDNKNSELEISIDEIVELYKPKKIVVDNYFDKIDELVNKVKNYDLSLCDNLPDRIISQFYKIQSCFDLIEDKDKYDLIIRGRIDMFLNECLKLEVMDKDSINIPNLQNKNTTNIGEYYYSVPHDSHGIIDVFSIGSYDNMQKYCNVFRNLDELCINKGFKFHAENLIYKNLLEQNVNISRFNLDFYLLRKLNK
jgi:hypothetical protein